ncbi:Signal transduction histidine kinase [Mucilaginibacter pineti]|uniref:histidine kinase n=1 Tax=Mucilaginibacter pineti TaxID=1391627 RepID=A0A1G6SQI5_9SPHI|nr:HAMP domain-containing sensor histidine kinase [Mucilaginibacter pineti]SDD19099.1 Signal transduction histidine kinase [Mucilaginibacter pineti]
MNLKNLISLCLMLIAGLCYGQQNDRYKVLNQKKKVCEAIIANFTGKSESFDELIKTGNDALKLTQPADHEYKLFFNQSIGVGYYYKQNFPEAKNHFETAYDEAVKAELIERSLKPLGNLVSIYHYMGMQQKADEAAQKLKQIAESTDTLKNKSDVYYNLGLYNQQQKFYYSIALSDFLKSVELHKKLADTTKSLKLKLDYAAKLMMVAEIYLYLKQPNKALQYLDDARPNLNHSIIFDVTAYGKFVRSYAMLNDQHNALKYYNLLHKTVDGTPGNWSQLISTSIEMANLALKAKDYKLAKSYIDKADKQAKIDNKEIMTSAVNMAYGDYYRAINDYATAGKYYKMGEHGAQVYNAEQYAEVLKSLTAVEIRTGNTALATQYFNKYIIVSDSLNQQKISLNLAETEAMFQNEVKQQKIGLLNKENDDKNIQLKQERTMRWLLVGGAAMLLIALFSIYLNFRNKQKANLLLDKKNQELDIINEQLTGANQTKAKLFGIISHDLRSPVSQLFTFLKLQQQPQLITDEQKAGHHQQLIQSSTDLLETMEDLLLWSKSQMENFALDIERIDINGLFNEASLMVKSQATTKQLEIKPGDVNLQALMSDQNLLIIILRNLLQNAINSAYANTAIYLNAGTDAKGKSFISVVNQADVIPAEKIDELLNTVHIKSKSSGYGLLIVKELLQKLNATLHISSDVGGTAMLVIFN